MRIFLSNEVIDEKEFKTTTEVYCIEIVNINTF